MFSSMARLRLRAATVPPVCSLSTGWFDGDFVWRLRHGCLHIVEGYYRRSQRNAARFQSQLDPLLPLIAAQSGLGLKQPQSSLLKQFQVDEFTVTCLSESCSDWELVHLSLKGSRCLLIAWKDALVPVNFCRGILFYIFVRVKEIL